MMMGQSEVIQISQQELYQYTKKKVLVLTPDLNIAGGVTNYYKTLMLDANSNMDYFAVNTAKPQGAVAATLRLVSRYFSFFCKVLFNKYEVVVVNPSLDMGRSFHRDLIFIVIAHLLGRETVVFFRGWFDPYEEKIKSSRWKKFLFKISYAKATKYVVLGKIFKNKLIGLGVPPQTKFHIETTVADSSFVKELSLENKLSSFEERIDFLFLSRIEKEKGIYIAIDAFADFQKKYTGKKTTLIIAGDGPDLAAVKEYVASQAIPGIQFLGHIGSEKKKKVLLESHIILFPSFTEGLPNTILEGMLYGMPIIARATGGIPEVITQEVNGFVTDSFESSVFLDFMCRLADSKDLYRAMAENNHREALEKYTSEKVKERITRIYEDSDF